MGTLGDRVGVDLMALFGSEEDQDQPDTDASNLPDGDTETTRALDPALEDSSEGDAVPTLEQILRDLIADLNGIDPDEINMRAPLDGDLDITGLALWAVVAEMERVASKKFADTEVALWRTPTDILNAASSA